MKPLAEGLLLARVAHLAIARFVPKTVPQSDRPRGEPSK